MPIAQKLNFGGALHEIAHRKVVSDVHRQGKPLPASLAEQPNGSIVKVKFEMGDKTYTLPMVTMPLFGPEYIRYPMQKGDKGYVLPGVPMLGNVSGLGAKSAPQVPDTANSSLSSNLGALVFFPMGNKDWTEPDDKDALINYGKTGTLNRDGEKKSIHKVHPTSGVTSNTGKKDDGTYKQKINIHPDDGAVVSADEEKHKTTWKKDEGIIHKSDIKVKNEAPITEATQDLQVGGNANIQSLLTAGSAAIGGFGMGGGGGSGASGAGGSGSLAMGGAISGQTVKAVPTTVGGLAGLSPTDGMRAFVTDSSVTTFNSVVAAGGTDHVPVYYNGLTTNWRVG